MQNRAASPDAGGWSYVAIVPLKKGANTIRLEHASRFPYFEKLLIAPAHTSADAAHNCADRAAIRSKSGLPDATRRISPAIKWSNCFRPVCMGDSRHGSAARRSGPRR